MERVTRGYGAGEWADHLGPDKPSAIEITEPTLEVLTQIRRQEEAKLLRQLNAMKKPTPR